jgi:hypothetical protein
MTTESRLMKEAAMLKYMSIGHGTLWRFRQKGLIRPIKQGRSVWYDKHDADALIEHLKEVSE